MQFLDISDQRSQPSCCDWDQTLIPDLGLQMELVLCPTGVPDHISDENRHQEQEVVVEEEGKEGEEKVDDVFSTREAYPELGESIRVIQNDMDEFVSLQAAIASLLATGNRDMSANAAGYSVRTSEDHNSRFTLPFRQWDERVQGDAVTFLQRAFPHLFFCGYKGACYHFKDHHGQYTPATTLSLHAFAIKTVLHCDMIPIRDTLTDSIIGTRRVRTFSSDPWYNFFLYKRLMYKRLM